MIAEIIFTSGFTKIQKIKIRLISTWHLPIPYEWKVFFILQPPQVNDISTGVSSRHFKNVF